MTNGKLDQRIAGHFNVSPVVFRDHALQYMECEKAFRGHASSARSPVPYFLLCRAIELELKARHLQHNTRGDVKRSYGHSLAKAYDDLFEFEKTLDSAEYDEFVRASAIYDIPSKGFEYVSVFDGVIGLEGFPNLDVLRGIADKLVGGVQ